MSLASSGITVSAVKSALGVSNNNVGGLCSSANVNHWSKWKPIAANVTTLTLNDLKTANYGITIKYATTPANLLSLVQSNSNKGYVYNKPTGISTSPYRLGDFRNYNHSAAIPVESHYKDNDVVKINGVSSDYKEGVDGIETYEPNDLDSIDYLTKSHIYPSTVKHRGIYITNGTTTAWSVGSIPWGQPQWQRFKGTTCTTLEFLTNLPDGTNSVTHTASSTDLFYALPEPLHTITASNATPSGSKDVWVNYIDLSFTDNTYAKVNYKFNFSSIGDAYAGGTLNRIMVGLASDSKGVNIISQATVVSGSITIGGEATSSVYSGTLTNRNQSPMVYFCIWYNSALKFVTMPMQEEEAPE